MFRNSKSKLRKVKQGVPQGGVLSPLLFNLYMSKMPSPPGNIRLVSYADDGNILNSGPQIEPIVKEINAYLDVLDEWFKARNLFISPSKSSATIFTTFSNEVGQELEVKINGEDVPTEKKPKILGVTFDGLLSFRQHVSNTKTKILAQNNILKALSGSTWGKEKEVIINTYKATGQSHLNYCCPLWTPSISKTSWDELQVAQNHALRIATGCHKMTNIDHLHDETKIMKVKDHCEMISKQFLLATQKPGHPNHTDLYRPPPPRQMKQTLTSKFASAVKPIARNLTEENYKKKLKVIHTNSVKDSLLALSNNKVLNTRPPAIDESEKNLPRVTRSTLAQLRSGYSQYLNSYKSRIDRNFNDKCPNCDNSHTSAHLFNCPGNPTNLTVQSLWTNPTDAARFLNLATDDGDPIQEG